MKLKTTANDAGQVRRELWILNERTFALFVHTEAFSRLSRFKCGAARYVVN